MAENLFTALLVFCLVGLLAMGSTKAEGEEATASGPPTFSSLSSDVTINMLKEISKKTEGNVILSPYSVATLLAILQQGARNNTLKQISDTLRMSPEESLKNFRAEAQALSGEKKDATLEWGNRLYIRTGFVVDDHFNQTVTEVFGSGVEEINFVEPSPQAAADKINGWVKEVTKDNIQNLIVPSLLTPDTVFLLLNAIYFKGLWDVPFSKLLTKPKKFETNPENSVEVPFMAQKDRFFAGEDPETGIQWVDLPFKDEQFSMLFILPRERHGLSVAMEKLNGALLEKIMEDDQTRQVTLHIPKFKLSQNVLLAGALKEMGITDIFTSDADLQGITPNFRNLVVSKIVHQANVEIDEEGSTASAASAIVVGVLSFPKARDTLEFDADHPFLFFILDRTNRVPLFAGKVVNPSS